MKQLAENLWAIQQPFKYLGLSVGTRMTIIRLENQDLVLISPIRLTPTIKAQVDRLGVVKHIVLPNLFHYLFASKWGKTYPESITYAVSNLQKKRPELTIDKFLNSQEKFWHSELVYLPFTGVNTLTPGGIFPLEEYVFYHSGK